MNILLQHIFLLNDVFRQRPNVVKRHIIGTQRGLSYCLVGVILHLSLPIYLERVKKTDPGLFRCWLPSGCADMLAEFIACFCEGETRSSSKAQLGWGQQASSSCSRYRKCMALQVWPHFPISFCRRQKPTQREQ